MFVSKGLKGKTFVPNPGISISIVGDETYGGSSGYIDASVTASNFTL